MLNFCDFIQVYVFTTNHHLNRIIYGTIVINDQFKKSALCLPVPD